MVLLYRKVQLIIEYLGAWGTIEGLSKKWVPMLVELVPQVLGGMVQLYRCRKCW